MKRTIGALTGTTFDLLVLGGGITGAGIALDAVRRGLSVALIDKGDFASGTSSVSSKLVHGGLRYLEHGDFRLVYEALTERRRLLQNAPHLVTPLRFVIPFYRGSRVPPWKWRAGLTLYDVLAGADNLAPSRPIPRASLLREFPTLRSASLLGGARYFDAQMDDARLCLEVIQTACLHGAVPANYVEATSFLREGNRLAGVQAIDRLTGTDLAISARQIVNAAGPWSDKLLRLAGDETGPHLSPTKGVHMIVANRPKLTSAFLLLHPQEGRVFFVIPWPPRDASKLLIGTTDTFDHEQPDALTVNQEEISYLLDAYNAYFSPTLSTTDVLGTFCGLRPLLHARSGDPSSLTREFRLLESHSGLISVLGGKYTTFRHMAEVATDLVVRRLGRGGTCRTRRLRLHGAPTSAWQDFFPQAVLNIRNRFSLPNDVAGHLVGRYGLQAFKVAEYVASSAQTRERLIPDEPELVGELNYQRDHEMAHSLPDLLLRRTRLGLFRPDLLTAPMEEKLLRMTQSPSVSGWAGS